MQENKISFLTLHLAVAAGHPPAGRPCAADSQTGNIGGTAAF